MHADYVDGDADRVAEECCHQRSVSLMVQWNGTEGSHGP